MNAPSITVSMYDHCISLNGLFNFLLGKNSVVLGWECDSQPSEHKAHNLKPSTANKQTNKQKRTLCFLELAALKGTSSISPHPKQSFQPICVACFGKYTKRKIPQQKAKSSVKHFSTRGVEQTM
jgi:hypothetical protein